MPEQKITNGLFTRSEEIPDERFRFFCAECGEPIQGFPYLTTWHGWCACFDPWDFCSEECWNKSEVLNPANWPPSTAKESSWNKFIKYECVKRHSEVSLIIQADNFILWRLLSGNGLGQM